MACSVEYQGQMFIIGGFYNVHRVSVVSECKLKYHATLPGGDDVQFFYHQCAVFNSHIWMCGRKHDDKSCYSYDGIELAEQPSTNYTHERGGLVSARKTLVSIGGFTNKVEQLDQTGEEWIPFGADLTDVLNGFTTLVYNDVIYVFG